VTVITAAFLAQVNHGYKEVGMAYKVLVAIDTMGMSELVLTSLSKQVVPDQTEVLVLEVVEPLLYSAPPEMSPGYQPEMRARRKERGDQAKRIVDSAVEVFRNAGFKADARVMESEIKDGVLQAATEWGADLIVVTSHARKRVAKFFHRSVAQAIVHEALCSVLVLKEPARKVVAA
jgi:nucleotide-binding universal stress UspA family protein